jgi:hypothetical protein
VKCLREIELIFDLIFVSSLARVLASIVRVSTAIPNPALRADSFSIIMRSWSSSLKKF